MKRSSRLFGAALVLAALVAAPALAQGPDAVSARKTIRATAEATVTATPDQAEMNVGVVTQAPTAEQASAENAKKTDAVLAAVRRALDAGAEVKTVGYSVTPNYVYPRDGVGEPRITGYTASNTVRVKTGDLTRVGPVIDAATGAGANNVQGLQFSLKDESAVKAEALGQAARKARQQAESIGKALGVTVTGVVYAEEGGPTVRPVLYDAMEARTAAAAKTPIEPGTVEVHATVTVLMSFM